MSTSLATPTTSGIRSPWTVGALSSVVVPDIFGVDKAKLALTRTQAMGVPAHARARHVVCGRLAGLPLQELEGDTPTAAQPKWLYRTDGPTSPWHRTLWTVDDLIHGGWALWVLRREAAGAGRRGAVLDAARVAPSDWSFDTDGVLEVYGHRGIDPDQVCLIPGPHEGVLNFAGRTLRTAAQLEDTVADRADNPVPLTELHDEAPDGFLTPQERDELLDSYRQARAKKGGAVAYTPNRISLKAHGEGSGDWLIQARNASAIDTARAVGVPAATVDASNVNSTLTYETQLGRNQELKETALDMYAQAITARLSLDDMTPTGRRVAFDFTQLTTPEPAPTGAPVED